MRRYAFIDAQNTESTAQQFCGFSIDWKKLYDYLHDDKWSCDKIFYYTGIETGDDALASEFENLAKQPGCTVRAKPVFLFKRRNKMVRINCVKCQEENISVVEMGYDRKANCDVELTIDVLENTTAEPEVELLIFTGDGDFEPLIRKVAGIAKKVYIISNTRKFEVAGLIKARFSSKLKKLLEDMNDKVFFINIDNLKNRIKRDII
ncbi:MAG: NYN domain-containing protein [bacterium]|nr:NYN domain-containing protein [bacterium]